MPGLYDASALTASGPIVATSGQVIENLSFTTRQSGPHIQIPRGVTGVVIRNNYFANSGANVAAYAGDGGAIMMSSGSEALIHHNEFQNNYRSLRAEAGGGSIDVRFVFNTAKDEFRNMVFIQNAGSGTKVVAYNELEWRQGNFASSYLTTTGDGNTLPSFFRNVEDGIGIYNSSGGLVLANKIRSTGSGPNPSFTGAGISLGDSGGHSSTARSNLVVNAADNGIQVSGGASHTVENNVIFADGSDTSLYTSKGGQTGNHGSGAWIVNRGLIWQAWGGSSCPTGGRSEDNLVYYKNAYGVSGAFVVLNGCGMPSGNDPIKPESPSSGGSSNWDGKSGGTPTQRWNDFQAWIDAVVAVEGDFGAN